MLEKVVNKNKEVRINATKNNYFREDKFDSD